MKVISVNIGVKKSIQYKGKIVETGIFKYPKENSIQLGFEDVENDAVIDRRYHGGTEKAVYGYSENHYNYWKKLYPKLDWHYGMFGENLTISNLDETSIHSGNVYQLGESLIEVTTPREPCMKLGIVFKTQQVLKQFWNSTKSGIYFKVLKVGKVTVGDELKLVSKKEANPTISEIYEAKKIK